MLAVWETVRKIENLSKHFSTVPGLPYRRMLTGKVIERVFRFLSFLLPFKSLILATSSGPDWQIAATLVSNQTLALVLIVIAVISFVIATITRRELDSTIDWSMIDVFELRRSSDSYRGTDKTRLQKDLRSTLDFYSAVVIVLSVFAVMLAVLPSAAMLNLALLLCAVYLLNAAINREDFSKFPEFLDKYSFGTQVVVLLSILVTMLYREGISYLAAIFAFVGTRQAWTSVSDAVRSILYIQGSLPPTYLEQDKDPAARGVLRGNVREPYLKPETGHELLRDLVSSALNQPISSFTCSWRDLAVRHTHSFLLTADSHHLLVNLFNERNLSRAEMEAEHSAASQFNGVTRLEFLGSQQTPGGGAANIYRHDNLKQTTRNRYFESAEQLFSDLWCVESYDGLANIPSATGISDYDLDVLRQVTTSASEANQIELFREHLTDVEDRYAKIPIALYVGDQSSKTVLSDEAGKLAPGPSANLSLQPVGSFLWRIHDGRQCDLRRIASSLNQRRGCCVYPDDLLFASAIFEIGIGLKNGMYANALAAISKTVRQFA